LGPPLDDQALIPQFYQIYIDNLDTGRVVDPGSQEYMVIQLAAVLVDELEEAANRVAVPASRRSAVTGWSETLGLRKGLQGPVVETLGSATEVIKLLNKAVAMQPCLRHVTITSWQMNRDSEAVWHPDSNGTLPAVAIGLQNYTGGELELAGCGGVSIRHRLVLFPSDRVHRSLPFAGRRDSFIGFGHAVWEQLSLEMQEELGKELDALNFQQRVASPEVDDDPAGLLFARHLTNATGHRGGEVRVAGTPRRGRRHRISPIDPRLWKWRLLFGAPWRVPGQHINCLEMQAYALTLQWRVRRRSRQGKRFVHLVDSRVVLSSCVKGRTSSGRLRLGLARSQAYNVILAGGLVPVLGYVRSHLNPADAPSRNKRPRRAPGT
jgi:hypothetical protein